MAIYDGPSADQFRSAMLLIKDKQRDIEVSLERVVLALSVLSDQLEYIAKHTNKLDNGGGPATVSQQLTKLKEQERAKNRWPSEYHGSISSFREIH